jgi:CDP-diacylglycerol---serine O-phosphatidyltransferase
MPPVIQKPMSTRRFSMLRSYALPDLLTMGNAASGTIAIFLCLSFIAGASRNYLWGAFALVPFGLVCDGLDGWVARKRGRSSVIGADMDSLADIVTFGLTPAILGYTLGMRGVWDAILLTVFVVCGISRLARYNVTAADMSDERGKVSHFQGTPIPTSVLLVLLLAVAFALGHTGDRLWLGAVEIGPFTLHPLSLLYLISGSLMISTIPIPKP